LVRGEAYSFGDIIGISCANGFELIGSRTLTCLSTGQWDAVIPYCQRIKCPELMAPKNGFKSTNSSAYNTTVVFSCSEGYHVVGYHQRYCRSDGVWTGDEVDCQLVRCPALLPIAQLVETNWDNSYGAVIEFKCPRGYQLRGAPAIQCQGKWKVIPLVHLLPLKTAVSMLIA